MFQIDPFKKLQSFYFVNKHTVLINYFHRSYAFNFVVSSKKTILKRLIHVHEITC